MTNAAASGAAINAVLPQTQCRLCGYSGCRPYADAIAAGHAPINQCPPGGDEVIAELAAMLDKPALPLSSAHGIAVVPAVARIEEAACIGCTLCLDACPVDAIVGARKLMHTVIAAECTGCALCLPPCPVDCIVMTPTGAPRDRATQRLTAPQLQKRYVAHQQRLEQRERLRRSQTVHSAAVRKKATIARAMARAQQRLADRKD